jgi:hypothetical protein
LSSRYQNMAPCQEPYNCFKYLKGLFTRTYSYEVIPPGMTTRYVFTAWITDLTSNDKHSLFPQQHACVLVPITCNQSPISHLVSIP